MADYRYLRVNRVDGVVVVHFVDAWATTDLAKGELGRELSAVVAQDDCSKLLVNCAELTYASSSMVGKLVALHKEVRRKGIKMVLCSLTPTVKDIFAPMKLNELFEIRETESEALQAFQ
jgi:anti-anti-sigma factor